MKSFLKVSMRSVMVIAMTSAFTLAWIEASTIGQPDAIYTQPMTVKGHLRYATRSQEWYHGLAEVGIAGGVGIFFVCAVANESLYKKKVFTGG
jgi:hypothetical protein